MSVGSQVICIARCLAAPQDLEVIALRWQGSDEFDARQPFRVHRFNYFQQPVPRFFAPLKRIVELAQTARILHKHLASGAFGVLEVGTVYPGAIMAQILFPNRRFCLVSYALGDDVLRPQRNWLTSRVFRRTLRSIDMFVAISNYTKGRLIEAGASPSRIVLIPPPIDQERFQRQGDPSNIKRKLPAYDLMLLTVCKPSEKKNIDQIIKLMPRLLGQFPGLLYVVAGDGPDLSRLRSLAYKENVQERVAFLGYVPSDELVDLYAAADVFVMVTKEDLEGSGVEGFGIVFLEAGSQGVPVIGPSRGGSVDAIIDEVTGYLVDPNAPEDIWRRLTELLGDADLRYRMGAAGKGRAFMRTDWSPLINLSTSLT